MFSLRLFQFGPRIQFGRRLKTDYAASRMSHVPLQSVWSEFTPLAQRCNAINMGQGFPDFPPEDFVLKATSDALMNNIVQYTRCLGHVRLVKAVATTYSPLLGRKIDPMEEILVTPGAQGALYAAAQAFIDHGDEVILIEPFYDSYPLCVKTAGGIPVHVPLRQTGKTGKLASSRDWKIDMDEFRRSITPKTKMIFINSPQNCPGKVYSETELSEIAQIAIKHDLLVLVDGVYEWMVYDNLKYTYLASLPGMWERTITIGSAGKSFSVTGFKIGWTIAAKGLIDEMSKVIQMIPFCVSSPLQEGVAVSFETAAKNNYWEELRFMFQKKRDRMVVVLEESGLEPVVPEGSYFIFASISNIPEKKFMSKESTSSKDYQFCRWLTEHVGVAAIPPSAFYSDKNKNIANNFSRFAFCKRDEVIEQAREKLKILKN